MVPLLAAGLVSAGASIFGSSTNNAVSSENNKRTNATNKWIAQLNAQNQSQIAAAERANKLGMQQTEQHFQEHMSSTNYQRTAADMEAAGLNRSLAATAGTAAALQSTNGFEFQRSILETLNDYLTREKNPRVSMIRSK